MGGGVVCDIMRRARHRYHYDVRCCQKKQKLDIQKEKLAENMTKTFRNWTEIKKDPTSKIVSTSIDQANSP